MDAKSKSPLRPSAWHNHRRGQVPNYVYKSIKEIYADNDSKQSYNLFGVVIDSRPAEMSKGSGKFFVFLSIILLCCVNVSLLAAIIVDLKLLHHCIKSSCCTRSQSNAKHI